MVTIVGGLWLSSPCYSSIAPSILGCSSKGTQGHLLDSLCQRHLVTTVLGVWDKSGAWHQSCRAGLSRASSLAASFQQRYCGTVFGRANCSDELLTFDMVERTGVEKTSVVCILILDFRATEQNTTRRVMLLNYTRYSAGCTSIYWGMLLSFTLLCT
ncbi:uncharacterized protein [Lolium perenne]|uniref:uncharacterized protein isoform X2 n=1 Tax=Lolium perenne TaxID=4522 RepID=UPI0021F6846B|nr:uncharacterized protein LOC127294688 isoform X2 [Lolium perenne]